MEKNLHSIPFMALFAETRKHKSDPLTREVERQIKGVEKKSLMKLLGTIVKLDKSMARSILPCIECMPKYITAPNIVWQTHHIMEWFRVCDVHYVSMFCSVVTPDISLRVDILISTCNVFTFALFLDALKRHGHFLGNFPMKSFIFRSWTFSRRRIYYKYILGWKMYRKIFCFRKLTRTFMWAFMFMVPTISSFSRQAQWRGSTYIKCLSYERPKLSLSDGIRRDRCFV